MEAMDVKYRPVLFPNGAVKKLKPASVPAPAPAPVGAGAAGELVYRECLKNHAASMGGHALDGCGEFMPSPAANPSDPTSLKCAACGCHRNFHRRFAEASPSPPPPAQQTMPAALPPPHLLHGHPHRRDEPLEDRLPAAGDDDSYDSDDGSDYDEDRSASPAPPPPPPPPQPQAYFSSAPHMLLALSSGAPSAPTPASRLPAPAPAPASAPLAPGPAAVARKRFRTKFSPEQKQRMQELSERLGWRLQKRDEAVVDECCREIGVGKGVFKVWMHNNKHNFLGGHSARRSASASAAAAAAAIHPSNPIPTPTAAPQTNTTDFNINGAAVANLADLHAGGHPANGGSPPSS